MKNINALICAMAVLFVCACDNDKEPGSMPQVSYADINIVTGLDFTDDNGNAIGRWRSPNNKPGEVLIFPNPGIGTTSLFSLDTIVRIWLIPADCLYDTVTMNIPERTLELDYSITDLTAAQIKDILVPDFNNQIALNFMDVEAGFYRLFYEMKSGELLWQNLFIDPTVNNIPSFGFLDDLCQ